MALEMTSFSAVSEIKSTPVYGNDKTKGSVEYNVDGKEMKSHEEREEELLKVEVDKDWELECELDEELSEEKMFEQTHNSELTKDDFGKDEKGRVEFGKDKEKKKGPIDPLSKHVAIRTDSMAGGNTIILDNQATGIGSVVETKEQFAGFHTEEMEENRELNGMETVVEDVYDIGDIDDIDDLDIDAFKPGTSMDFEESDRMAFPDLDDELVGEMMPRSPWA
jgi:hypothetical protein